MLKRLISTYAGVPIYVTNNAWHKMQDVIYSQSAYCFFFSAENGGCHGFNYKLNLMDEKKYNDFTKNITNINLLESKAYRAKLLLDPFSEMMLFGTTIDFINEDFNKEYLKTNLYLSPIRTW